MDPVPLATAAVAVLAPFLLWPSRRAWLGRPPEGRWHSVEESSMRQAARPGAPGAAGLPSASGGPLSRQSFFKAAAALGGAAVAAAAPGAALAQGAAGGTTYSNVTVYTLRAGGAAEALTGWAETALPTFRQEAGFRGLLLLGDEEGTAGQIVTLWESQEAMAAALAGPRHPERLEALLRVIEPPTQRPHRVLLHALTLQLLPTPRALPRTGSGRA